MITLVIQSECQELKQELAFGLPILTRRTSVAACWCASFGRPGSSGRNGKRFDLVPGKVQDRCPPTEINRPICAHLGAQLKFLATARSLAKRLARRPRERRADWSSTLRRYISRTCWAA